MVMAVGPSVLTYMQFHSSIDIPGLLDTVKDIFVRVGHETTCASSVDKPFLIARLARSDPRNSFSSV